MARRRVLLEDSDEALAKKLQASPGEWFVIALGDKKRLQTIATTGSRINKNKHKSFTWTDQGYFEATVRSNTRRWSQKAPVEMHGRWRIRTFENPGPDR